MSELKRKQALPADATAAPSKKPCLAPPSTPSTPLPEPATRPLLNGPVSREISTDSHQTQNLVEVFTLFCPEALVDEWVRYINEDRPTTWLPTCREEIYLFFGALLNMKYSERGALERYWTTLDESVMFLFARCMTKDRYFDIYVRFCTWDATEEEASGFDKIKGWSSQMQSVWSTFDTSSSSASVDKGHDKGHDKGQPAKSSTSAKPARAPGFTVARNFFMLPVFIDQYNNDLDGLICPRKKPIGDSVDWGIRLESEQARENLSVLQAAFAYTFLLQRRRWNSKKNTKWEFGRQLYLQIFEQFALHVNLRNKGVATSAYFNYRINACREKRGC